MRKLLLAAVAALALAGCASYDGRGLSPGASTAQEVEALMGPAALRVTQSDGSSVLYFPRRPEGRHTYAVTVGPDGRMRSIEQRLTLANYNKLMVGKTTSKEVRELFGPPDEHTKSYLPLARREVWEYKWLDYQEKRVFWMQFSDDGILRESMNSRDDFHESPGAGLP